MRLAMAQMRMHTSMEENLKKTLELMEQAKKDGAELIFFPELQLTPFFPSMKSGTPLPGFWISMPRRFMRSGKSAGRSGSVQAPIYILRWTGTATMPR